MLERRTAPNGVVYYRSPLLHAAAVPHAFSTRLGGVSLPPFDSLNLGNPNGCPIQDDRDRIARNYILLEEAIGLRGRERSRLHQVHGGVVVRTRTGEAVDPATKADAMVGSDPATYLSVRVADCVPVLLATEDGRTVAAIHAGWRGVIAGVATATARVIAEHDAIRSHSLLAAIGPSIGFDAFEVGPEVLEAFDRGFGDEAPVRARPHGKGHVDLRAALRIQLLRAGLLPERIDITDRCTHRDADEFFSHRRDDGVTGRMVAIIGTKKCG